MEALVIGLYQQSQAIDGNPGVGLLPGGGSLNPLVRQRGYTKFVRSLSVRIAKQESQQRADGRNERNRGRQTSAVRGASKNSKIPNPTGRAISATVVNRMCPTLMISRSFNRAHRGQTLICRRGRDLVRTGCAGGRLAGDLPVEEGIHVVEEPAVEGPVGGRAGGVGRAGEAIAAAVAVGVDDDGGRVGRGPQSLRIG